MVGHLPLAGVGLFINIKFTLFSEKYSDIYII